MEIAINKQTIDFFTQMICYPEEIGLDIKPLKEVFIKSKTLTSNSDLYKQYFKNICAKQIPKVFFYIVMEKTFGPTSVEYSRDITRNEIYHSDAGYYLTIKPELIIDNYII